MNKFRDDELWWKVHLDQLVEKEIFKSLDKAESLLEEDPELGKQSLNKANELYHKRGYDYNIECRIKDVHFLYVDKDLIPNI